MAATPTPTPATATTTPGYTWVSEIAKGGLGTVSLVLRREGRFERLYALKRLHPHLREDPEVRTMFMEEARIAGLLRHPNVVGVLDVGEDDDGPFLVMEYVDGLSLSTAVKILARRGEHTPISIVVDVIRQTAEGLRWAHELVTDDGTPCPIVHRDVSPQNILLGFDGIVRVTDFGIAKAIGGDAQTTTHALKGKYGYMSPEQLRFARLDARSDLFSLGVVTWEMAAGQRLFPGRELEATAERILHDPPPELLGERADAPAELERILFGLLAKDREHRTQSAAALLEQLGELARTLAAEPEDADLRAFLAARFADYRDQSAAERATAVRRARDQLDAPSAAPARPTAGRPRSRGLIAGALIAGSLLGAGALFAAQRFGGDPSPSAIEDDALRAEAPPPEPTLEDDGAPTNDAPTNDAPTNDAPTNDAPTNDAPIEDAIDETDDPPEDDAAEIGATEEERTTPRTTGRRSRASRRAHRGSTGGTSGAAGRPVEDWWE